MSQLGCCGVAFCGCWDARSFFFFATGPVAAWMRRCLLGAGTECKHIQRQSWRFDSSLVRVYFGAQVALTIEDQSNLPRIFSIF